nr:TetR/AcrR family transcriptional regulator [uncultured Arsenicibacter sp.]
MGVLERKLRQKEEVRNSILTAAWSIIQTEGWQALSIRKIADAIEYSVPVIYNHFESKEAIMLEFVKEGFRQLRDHIQAQLSEEDRSCQQLEIAGKAYWQFAFANQATYQLMFGMGLPPCERARQVPEIQSFSTMLVSLIQKVIDHSNQPDTNAFLKFHTFWSILHGLVSIQMINRSATPDELSELVLEDAIYGFIKALVV